MKTRLRKILFGLAAVVGLGLAFAPSANAQWWGNGYVYYPRSVHYHRTSVHWTPNRGLHTHGHYDLVPHYTPSHSGSHHNGHHGSHH